MKTQQPTFLSARNIGEILNISYPDASKLMDLNICPLYVIGNTRRVLATDFYKWLELKK